MSQRRPTILFLQCTDAAAYPPTINACGILAEAGWRVSVLSTAIAGMSLGNPFDHRIKVFRWVTRQTQSVSVSEFSYYLLATVGAVLRERPDIVYASDPPSAIPALLARALSGAKIVYHEHDCPNLERNKSLLIRMRRLILSQADALVFPNAERAKAACNDHAIDATRVRVVWNVPRLTELPPLQPKSRARISLYYHGSITPDRIPRALATALRELNGAVTFEFAGYEAACAKGYIEWLVAHCVTQDGVPVARYMGQISRDKLLDEATRHNIGLSIMPLKTDDLNMHHMVGASNKAFDYLIAGLPLVVTDLPEWRSSFVDAGFARSCDPDSAASIAEALRWYLDHFDESVQMGLRGREKIESEWNYEAAFAPIQEMISSWGFGVERCPI